MYRDFVENKLEILPNIYKNKDFHVQADRPILPVVSGTSGSGKDFVVDRLKGDKYFKHLVTATSRLRRYKAVDPQNEAELQQKFKNVSTREEHEAILNELEQSGLITTEPLCAYVWMRFPKTSAEISDPSIYYSNLKEEYGLVESDAHLGNFYGLPKSSIASLLLSKDINQFPLPVIRTDFSGMKTITNIFANDFSILNLAIVPDSPKQAIDAVLGRQSNISQEELDERVKEYELASAVYAEYAHYYVKNTREEINGEAGIEVTTRSLEELLRNIQKEY